SLFRTLHHHLDAGDVLLADRYYCGYVHLALVRQRGADIVMRLHQRRHSDFRRGRRMGAADHLVHWHKPKHRPEGIDADSFAQLPATLSRREVPLRVPHPTSRSREIGVVSAPPNVHVDPKATPAKLHADPGPAEPVLAPFET